RWSDVLTHRPAVQAAGGCHARWLQPIGPAATAALRPQHAAQRHCRARAFPPGGVRSRPLGRGPRIDPGPADRAGQATARHHRRAADPDDPAVRTIEQNEVPNAGTAGASAAWTNILLQACRSGPRMVAALLLTAPADAFGADRDRFLEGLQQP